MKWRLRLPPPEPSEGSLRLRVAVFLNTAFAFVALAAATPEIPVWLPLAVTAVGAAFSARYAHRSSWLVKTLLALGMLYALYDTLDALVRGSMDPRLALAQLLMWLQMLNSFDLPRRKNLRVALLVATILVVVAATLSRTGEFGFVLMGFGFTLLWAEYEAFLAEVGQPRAKPGVAMGVVAALMAGIIVIGTPLFAYAPRQERQMTMRTLPVSFQLPLPEQLDARLRRPGLTSTAAGGRGEGALGVTSFGSQLDLDVRSQPDEAVVLRVKSARPQYWRALAFDAYDGRLWRMSAPDAVDVVNQRSGYLKLDRPRGQAGGNQLVQTFYPEREVGNLIYAAWTPTALFFPTSLVWRDNTDGLRSPLLLEKEMYYSVISETPLFTRRALEARPEEKLDAAFDKYLAHPPLSARTRELVATLTAHEPSPYRKMIAMADHLRGAYPYKLDVPKAPPGREWVDYFLFEQKIGYCEHFATSLAVMGRQAGVPTRLVTGYQPGDYNPFTGFYEVKGKHAHAWVEAWMPKLGWVPFDPTPAAALDEFGLGAAQPADNVAAALWRVTVEWLAAHMGWVLLAAAGAGVLVGPRVLKRLERPPVSPATRHYCRLRQRLARRGVSASPSDTPGAWLAAVAARPELATALPAIERFVACYEAQRFGGEAGDLAEAASAAERALASAGSGYKGSKRKGDC